MQQAIDTGCKSEAKAHIKLTGTTSASIPLSSKVGWHATRGSPLALGRWCWGAGAMTWFDCMSQWGVVFPRAYRVKDYVGAPKMPTDRAPLIASLRVRKSRWRKESAKRDPKWTASRWHRKGDARRKAICTGNLEKRFNQLARVMNGGLQSSTPCT